MAAAGARFSGRGCAIVGIKPILQRKTIDFPSESKRIIELAIDNLRIFNFWREINGQAKTLLCIYNAYASRTLNTHRSFAQAQLDSPHRGLSDGAS